jgi:hypothetical protein
MEQNIVIIFSNDWRIVGYIALTKGALYLTEESLTDVPEIAGLVVNDINALGADSISLENAREQLKKAGVRAHMLDARIVPLLKQVSEGSFDANLRNQVVPDILGLDVEHQRTALEAVLHAA